MPPPNITGQLHLGHALGIAIQDAIARRRRFEGYDALYLPGTDHAGIATHQKILSELNRQGLEPSRENYDRIAQEWQQTHEARISSQMKQLGASARWSAYRFTLDAQMTAATQNAFITLFNRGLIYEQDGSWFLKTSQLAQKAIASLDRGELTIAPQSQTKIYRDFLEQQHDWEISRQIDWGHQIAAWQNQDTGEWQAAIAQPGDNYIQCPYRLDTWFTSSLYPFAALTPELEKYYSADFLETGKDILCFWGARMAMLGLELTGQTPFKQIYLHGLIRDEQNRKMSKSLGNGILPETIIAEYGTDALRWALIANHIPGKDFSLTDDKLLSAKRLINKLWNAGKLIGNLSQYENEQSPKLKAEWADTKKQLAQAWIQNDTRLASTILYRWFFNRFCAHYLEKAKADQLNLSGYFNEILEEFTPITPFICEELSSHLNF